MAIPGYSFLTIGLYFSNIHEFDCPVIVVSLYLISWLNISTAFDSWK